MTSWRRGSRRGSDGFLDDRGCSTERRLEVGVAAGLGGGGTGAKWVDRGAGLCGSGRSIPIATSTQPTAGRPGAPRRPRGLSSLAALDPPLVGHLTCLLRGCSLHVAQRFFVRCKRLRMITSYPRGRAWRLGDGACLLLAFL